MSVQHLLLAFAHESRGIIAAAGPAQRAKRESLRGNPRPGISFAASREPVLEVFDTRCFQRVGVIAIKDPIIGPLKTAIRGTRIVAVGATARGVVVLDLNPADYAATCN